MAKHNQVITVPAGWVLVPIEPNWDMRNEGREFLIDGLEKDYEKIAYFLWKTMVNASPTAPTTRPPALGELTDAKLVAMHEVMRKASKQYAQTPHEIETWESEHDAFVAKAAREFLGKVDG